MALCQRPPPVLVPGSHLSADTRCCGLLPAPGIDSNDFLVQVILSFNSEDITLCPTVPPDPGTDFEGDLLRTDTGRLAPHVSICQSVLLHW
jgi:hypothetical protein